MFFEVKHIPLPILLQFLFQMESLGNICIDSSLSHIIYSPYSLPYLSIFRSSIQLLMYILPVFLSIPKLLLRIVLINIHMLSVLTEIMPSLVNMSSGRFESGHRGIYAGKSLVMIVKALVDLSSTT